MSRPSGKRQQARRRPRTPADPARRAAFDALRAVSAADAYTNLALREVLDHRRLSERDTALATELVAGTARLQGTYDVVIARAGGRELSSLQPAVVDVLRLGAHQILSMRIPVRAGVDASVDLARAAIGERVTGVVNAILRKVAAQDVEGWLDQLSAGTSGARRIAVRSHHPQWIVEALADALADSTPGAAGTPGAADTPPMAPDTPAVAPGSHGEAELVAALGANNLAPTPTLVVRPGLTRVDELAGAGAEPTPYSPFGASYDGNPGALEAVRAGRAGVQDEGSQLVAAALAQVSAPQGRWLDMCAGPGGKSALLAGLARTGSEDLVASEVAPHRADLVAQGLRAYDPPVPVLCADGRHPAWHPGSFTRVMVDAPCTGLGALRRRPESRWRHRPADLEELVPLQRDLLTTALASTAPGGVVAYVTCSPHRDETVGVLGPVLDQHPGVELLDAPQVLGGVVAAHATGPLPNCSRDDGRGGRRVVQLWPHRHGTDAMFLALVRVPF